MPYPSDQWRAKYGEYKALPEHDENHNSTVAILSDSNFKLACELAKVQPRKGTARKFKNKRGKVWQAWIEHKKTQELQAA